MANYLTRLRHLGMAISMLMLVLAGTVIAIKGVPLGQDFTGGYVHQFQAPEALTQQQLQHQLEGLLSGDFQLSAHSDNQYQLFQPPSEGQSNPKWLDTWVSDNALVLLDSSFLGAQAGDELIDQGLMALLFATLAVMLYLVCRFEWRLALSATLALVHDVALTLAVLVLFDIPFTLTVLAAILAIIGYSLNDSIVIGDKVREIVRAKPAQSVALSINTAIAASMSRTLITSMTTLATIISIWTLAGPPLQGFAITLFVGVLVGTWSSVFISATVPHWLGLSAENYTNQDSDEVKRQLAQP